LIIALALGMGYNRVMNILIVAFGGGLGAVCRYCLSKVLSEHGSNYIPLGTITVNLVGSFLIGFLFEAFAVYEVRPATRLFLTTGFLGGFTTFSTYALESVNLLRERQYLRGFLDIAFHDVLGLVMVVLGVLAFKGIRYAVGGGTHD